MDHLTLGTVRRVLACSGLQRLALEDELCHRLGIDWARSAVAVQWLIEEAVLCEDAAGTVRLALAEPSAVAPPPR